MSQPPVEDLSPAIDRRGTPEDPETIVADFRKRSRTLCRKRQSKGRHGWTAERRQQVAGHVPFPTGIRADDGVPHETVTAAEVFERSTSRHWLDHETLRPFGREEVFRPPFAGFGGNRLPDSFGFRGDEDLKLAGRVRQLSIRQSDSSIKIAGFADRAVEGMNEAPGNQVPSLRCAGSSIVIVGVGSLALSTANEPPDDQAESGECDEPGNDEGEVTGPLAKVP